MARAAGEHQRARAVVVARRAQVDVAHGVRLALRRLAISARVKALAAHLQHPAEQVRVAGRGGTQQRARQASRALGGAAGKGSVVEAGQCLHGGQRGTEVEQRIVQQRLCGGIGAVWLRRGHAGGGVRGAPAVRNLLREGPTPKADVTFSPGAARL
jgi:hypothetical protein